MLEKIVNGVKAVGRAVGKTIAYGTILAATLLPACSSNKKSDYLALPQNNPPTLEALADLVANEGDLIEVIPTASDPDNNPLTFLFSYPFDSVTGKWQTS